jgi:hypothetical protein
MLAGGFRFATVDDVVNDIVNDVVFDFVFYFVFDFVCFQWANFFVAGMTMRAIIKLPI